MIQKKLAFLLVIVAFLSPSDLARISWSTTKIAEDSHLYFNVIAPKEKRNGIRIIKHSRVYPHTDASLCPVQTFQVVANHPLAISHSTDALFVRQDNFSFPVRATILGTWLRNLITRSTSESRVSSRYLGSSLALRQGISVEDIVTLGNWRSSTTFHDHY